MNDFEQLQSDLETLQHGMEQLTETARLPDGLVAATVGARGELTGLVLDPDRINDAEVVAAAIVATIRQATDAVTARMIELAEPLLPTGPGFDNGLDAIVRQFGEGCR